MAKAIATNEIGGDLYCEGDLIWEDTNMGSTAAITSGEFLLAQTMGAAQVNIVAGAAGCATAAGQTLTITAVTAPASGGTFDNTVWTFVIPASTTYAAGASIANFLPERDVAECYTKLVATSVGDMTADELTAYQVGVC